MRIELKKFGDILTSREAGREALSAYLPTLKLLGENEGITIDFQDVSVLTPSWADEFIRPILEKYSNRVTFIHDTNPSVQAALRFADPKLDLSKITVREEDVVFDELIDRGDKASSEKSILTLTFPYNDQDALRILKNNNTKKIQVYTIDILSNSRLEAFIQILNQAGIATTIYK